MKEKGKAGDAVLFIFCRIEKIEWLDELEEWNIIQKHYYFALCSRVKDQAEDTKFVRIAKSA